jgi:hypothetical protein
MSKLEYDPLSSETPEYVFCESIHAAPWSKWHLRKFDGTWKLGGACPPPLCWAEGQSWTGWDLNVRLTPFHLERNCCQRCLKLMEANP